MEFKSEENSCTDKLVNMRIDKRYEF